MYIEVYAKIQYLECYATVAFTSALFDTIIEPDHEKTCLKPYANNMGADQAVHPHSLFSIFIVRYLDSTISDVAQLPSTVCPCSLPSHT